MPSEKRARQRALREQKLAVQERHHRRRRILRRSGTTIVIAAALVGVIFLVSSGSGKKTPPTTTTLRTVSGPPQVPICPASGSSGASYRITNFSAAPPSCISSKATYDATITTNAGTFVVQMPAAKSFLAVNNFVFLARWHFYDGIIFQRVIPGFVVQGGDPTGTGSGGDGYSYTGNTPSAACAKTKTKICYPLGSVAVANSGDASSDGSQFFVVVGPEGETLAPNYTLFGKVVAGMAVVDKIAAAGTTSGKPTITYHMETVTIKALAAKA